MEVQSTTTVTTAAAAPSPSLLLIRNLAACNTTTRSKSLRELTAWLPTQSHITDEEMKKLWKGLFYCIWHADKAVVQSNLINRLASMLFTLQTPLSLHYFSVFLTTVRREWSGIDVLRLDKFYLLIRRFVSCGFELLRKNSWDLDLCGHVMSVYETKALFANDKFLGNGVSYHIVSVFIDEVKGYLPVKEEVWSVLVEPLLKVLCVCNDKVLVGKVRSAVFERLLFYGRSLIEKRMNNNEDGIEDEVVNLGTVALKMGFAARFYELGSSSECLQGNRKVLFGLNKEFLKLEKELEVSGVEVLFPDVVGDDGDDEVPDLVPIVFDETREQKNGEGDAKKSKKKKKKKNKAVKEVKESSDSQDIEMKKENEDNNVIIANGESLSNGNDVTFSDFFKLNLQKEFEKIADEEGLEKDGESSLQDLSTLTIASTKVPKKRKRVRSADARDSNNVDVTEQGGTAIKSGEKSAKKVRFSIKNNLVWKPQTPLPPQSLRIPPSVTPRGSALKQGVPPGPVREMRPAVKRVKKKKVRKVVKTTSPAVKRLRKLQTVAN